MFLSVKEMELRKVRFDETFQPGQIDFTDEGLEQGSPLHAVGSAELLAHSEGEVRVQGQYTVEMGAQCDRCLGRARFPLEARFDLFYRPMQSITREEEVRLKLDDTEIAFFEGDGLFLADVLAEQVLLAIPMKVICRSDCRGLCPHCGANLNNEECRCEKHSSDPRLAPLARLKQDWFKKQ